MAGDNESKTAVALVDPLVGSIFDKRFRIEARIAQGGFGAIYRATHVKSGHPIALKVLLPTLAQDLGIVARFRREGDALTALRNPHTITAYELGQAADRTLFIVMELLHGESLFDRYEHNGPFEWKRMLRIARQVCESLAEAHALGIVHRDLKPTNIHLEDLDGDPDFVKVLDFGIAKILRGSESFDASDITNAGTMIGTLDYMSPEQMVGGQVTGQTDIYTVGIVMYEMIAGVRPFPEAQTAAAALGAMLKTTPQELYLRAPIPEQVSKVVMRCLEREVGRRYRSVGDLMAAIDAVLSDTSHSSLDSTSTYDLDATRRAPKEGSADDEATTFTPPPEKLLDSMRTPKVEREGLWDDGGTDDATTIGNARHNENIARDVRSDRAVSRAETKSRDEGRAGSRADTKARDDVDPHGPTIAARVIEGSGEHAPIVRAGSDSTKRASSEGAKTPIVQRDSDAKTPTVRRDSDGMKTPVRLDNEGAKTPTARLDSEMGSKTPTVRRDEPKPDPPKVQSARSDFDIRSSSGRPVPEGRARPPTRPPSDVEARARPATVPPSSRARPQSVPPSGIPSTPPPRPLQARNLATPVPSVVVAPFSSTPRRPTPPPTGIPTPSPGSLPPGVPMPPTRPTPYPPGVPIPPTPGQPMPQSGPTYGGMPGQLTMPQGAPGMPRPNIATPLPGGPQRGVPTPPPGPPYQPPGGNPNAFSPNAMPGSNPNANPFAAGQAPGSNPSANPFNAGQAPSSNPFGAPMPPTGPVSLPHRQFDMSKIAARDEMIRRLVWIGVIAIVTIIGVVLLAR